jgi:Zn-dependent peptidase ImmA (M78 family)
MVRARREMRTRGRCDTSRSGPPTVLVRWDDNRYAQGFTVAHEVAHLLLERLPLTRRRELGYERVERLCDEFAHNVIVPPAALAAELGPEPAAPSPADTLRLCGLFEANPSVMLRALARQIPLERKTYLLARKRGHYRRPAAVEYRVASTAGGGGLFWPKHIRLSKLGLVNLTAAAETSARGASFHGAEVEVVVQLERLDRETGHNAMAGPVRWQAVAQGRDTPYVLALVDCHEFRGVRVSARDTAAKALGEEIVASDSATAMTSSI